MVHYYYVNLRLTFEMSIKKGRCFLKDWHYRQLLWFLSTGGKEEAANWKQNQLFAKIQLS